MPNVIYKQKKVNWIHHQVCDSYTFLQMLYHPVDRVDNDVSLAMQLRWIATDCAELLFEKMTHLASVKQKKSRGLNI